VILVENPEQVVYNSRTWYCPAKVLGGTVLRTRRQGDWFSRADSTGGKPLRRFLTDRKIPGFIRDRMILAAHESQVLWIPGIAHAEGFVDEASGRKFFGLTDRIIDKLSLHDTELYRVTISDRNEQEEH
jgi:tRNA(Ile)-lysidine synthetase-like protein